MTAEPACCRGGIELLGGRWSCLRHATREDRALLASLDRRAARVGVPRVDLGGWMDRRRWPYGPARSAPMRMAMLDWAETGELRPLDRRGCAAWLAGGRCAGRGGPADADVATLRHVTYWRAPGARVLVAHPRLLDGHQAAALGRLATPLEVSVSRSGWLAGALQVELRAPA